MQDILDGDQLLMDFCRGVTEVFGQSFVTPNMHLHGHLKDCMLDYGPVHSFWLFSFERCNGICSAIPNSNRTSSLPHEFMRFWQRQCRARTRDLDNTGEKNLLDQLFGRQRESTATQKDTVRFLLSPPLLLPSGSEFYPGKLLHPLCNSTLLNSQLQQLATHYEKVYGVNYANSMNPKVTTTRRLELCSLVYGKKSTRMFKCTLPNQDLDVLCRVRFFFEHNIIIQGNMVRHSLAFVDKYAPDLEFSLLHPSAMSKPQVEVWSKDCEESIIIPVQCIRDVCAFSPYLLENRE